MGGLCDKKFMSQASSLSFLANQGFDFNKLIKEGKKYLKKIMIMSIFYYFILCLLFFSLFLVYSMIRNSLP
jgi:hypothetical protein